jgi:hypothetical protein
MIPVITRLPALPPGGRATYLHAYHTHRIGRVTAHLVLLTWTEVDAGIGLEGVTFATAEAQLAMSGDHEQHLLGLAGGASRRRPGCTFEHGLF